MWRVAAIVVAIIAVTLLVIKPEALGQKSTEENKQGLVLNEGGSVFYVKHPDVCFVLYLPGAWSSSSRSSSNSATGSWITDVTLEAKDKSKITLASDSKNPTQVTLNDAAFDLAAGSIFQVNSDGRVQQLPFAPLPVVDLAYVKQLNHYFGGRNAQPPVK